MTCIIAKVHEGKVHMIGDREGSNGFIKHQYDLTPKVFKNGEFIIGYTTSFRMGQILQYSWTPPTKSLDDSDDKYIYKVVVDSIKKCFDDNSYGHKPKDEFIGGNFLLGWKGRLFEVQENLSVMEFAGFASVGCGCYHALASMKTLEVIGYKLEVEEQLATALLVAADSVSGVSKEYTYICED